MKWKTGGSKQKIATTKTDGVGDARSGDKLQSLVIIIIINLLVTYRFMWAFKYSLYIYHSEKNKGYPNSAWIKNRQMIGKVICIYQKSKCKSTKIPTIYVFMTKLLYDNVPPHMCLACVHTFSCTTNYNKPWETVCTKYCIQCRINLSRGRTGC